MTVIQSDDGTFSVTHDGVCLRDGFETSAAAWRWVDRHDGEPISPQEKRTAWIVSKIMGEAE